MTTRFVVGFAGGRERLLGGVAWLVSCAALACTPPPPPPASPEPASAGAKPTASSKVKANDETPSKPIDRASLPKFANADLGVEVEYPERVRIVRVGRLYVEQPPVKDDDAEADRSIDWEPPLIEAGNGTRPYRVLCRDPESQIATYVPAHQLATLATEPVVLSPKATPPESTPDNEPGVRVAKGAILTVMGSLNAVDQVRFESVGLAGEGFARRVKLGPVYRPDASAASAGAATGTALAYQAELGKPEAALYSEPDASRRPIARLTPYPDGDNQHRFQRVGPRRSGFALVRLLHPETTVVGWIEEANLSGRGGQVTFSKDHKTSSGRLRGSKMISVKKGAVLLGPTKKEPVGVVVRDHEAPCIRRCESDAPVVAMRACGGTVRVVTAK